MSELTPRERELVALGAALGSYCVPLTIVATLHGRLAASN